MLSAIIVFTATLAFIISWKEYSGTIISLAHTNADINLIYTDQQQNKVIQEQIILEEAKEVINFTQKQEVKHLNLHPYPFQYIDNATKFYIDRKWIHVFQYVINKPIVYTNPLIK